MGKPSAPAPIDYQGLTAQGGQENRATAEWNANLGRVNQVGPYGSVTWGQTPGATPSAAPAAAPASAPAPAPAPSPYSAGMGNQQRGPDGGEWADGGVIQRDALSSGSFAPPPPPPNTTGAPTPGQWTQTTTLSPEQQKLYQNQLSESYGQHTAAMGALGGVQGMLGKPMDTSGLGSMVTQGRDPTTTSTGNDYAEQRKSVEEALYSRLDPQFARDDEALRTRLANQGIAQGSDAWNREIENANQAKTDARYQAVMMGGQEQSRLAGLDLARQQQSYGQGLASDQFTNAAYGQGLQQLMAQRMQPLNEYNSLRSGQIQVPQAQQYSAGNAAPADPLAAGQLAGQQQQAAYAGQMGGYNSTIGGLGSAAMAAAVFF